MVIHACLQRTLFVLRKGICRHGDNRNSCLFGIRHFADFPCGIIATQNRHLNIHQNQLIKMCRCLFQHFHTFHAIRRAFHQKPFLLQKRNRDFRIQIVILCKQNPLTDKRLAIRMNLCALDLCVPKGRNTAGNPNREGRAFPHPTVYFNLAMHHLHQLLHDTHAKPRAFHAADRRGAFSGEGFKNMLLEFL